MAEAVGLALGVLGLAGLVSTCTDCLELVRLGGAYATDYELLQTKFETQKLRFLIWTQVSGFTQGLGYDTRLDNPTVQPIVARILNNLYRLLSDEQQLSRRYGLRMDNGLASMSGRVIFRESYQRFHARLHRAQRETGISTKAKWAIYDKQRFENLVRDLKDLVDSLDEISRSLQLLQRTDDLLAAEVESVTDPGSLRLLEEAFVDNERLSDTASRRLRVLQGSARDPPAQNVAGNATVSSDSRSFRTAPSSQAFGDGGIQDTPLNVESTRDEVLSQNQRLARDFRQLALRSTQTRSYNTDTEPGGPIDVSAVGKKLHRLRESDMNHARDVVQRTQADATPQEMRIAMILERYLNSQPTSFVSLTPIGDNLLQLLGRVEGPPGSPYQNGVFHVQISISDDFPFSPPVCQCLTKVFHPNIDQKGKICLETLEPRNWRMELINLEVILLSISALLDQPNVDDPLVPEVAAIFIQDRPRFDEIAREWTAKFAGEQNTTNLSVSTSGAKVSDWRKSFLKDRLGVVQARAMTLITSLERGRGSQADTSAVVAPLADSVVSSYISLLYQLTLQLNDLNSGLDKREGDYEVMETFFDACILQFVALAKDDDWHARFPFLHNLMKNDVTRGTGNPDTHDWISAEKMRESKKVLQESGFTTADEPEEMVVRSPRDDRLLDGMQRLIRHATWLNGDEALVRIEREVPSVPSGPPTFSQTPERTWDHLTRAVFPSDDLFNQDGGLFKDQVWETRSEPDPHICVNDLYGDDFVMFGED